MNNEHFCRKHLGKLSALVYASYWLPAHVRLSYLTIIPRARMGYESIAHEAEGRMGYFRGYEGERNNCFSKIQLVGQKNIKTKHLSLVKAIILVFKAGAFRY